MRKSLCPDFARLLFLRARPYFHLCLSGLRHEGGTIRSLVHDVAHVRHAAVTTTTEKCLLTTTTKPHRKTDASGEKRPMPAR